MEKEQIYNWHLGEKDFFIDLQVEKDAFKALSKIRKFDKNSFIFFEEEPCQSCYYLERGLINIFKTTLQGKEPIFFIRKQGDIFGIAEVIDSKPRKANALVLAPSVLWEISKTDFETLLANYPKFCHRVIQVLGRRIRYLGQIIENLVVCDVTTRLAKLLVYLSFDLLSDEESWLHPVTVPIKLTQSQMASMTGSCQQTISETLRSFQVKGLITISKKKITILNPLQLLSSAAN